LAHGGEIEGVEPDDIRGRERDGRDEESEEVMRDKGALHGAIAEWSFRV
jgi:hypothetical protein